jgi:hypothetical protein
MGDKKKKKKMAPEFHLKNGAGCRGIQPRKSGHCTILPPTDITTMMMMMMMMFHYSIMYVF